MSQHAKIESFLKLIRDGRFKAARGHAEGEVADLEEEISTLEKKLERWRSRFNAASALEQTEWGD